MIEIICGNALDVLRKFPRNYVDCVITSPPYWDGKKYDERANAVWGGDGNCKHRWNRAGFCRCGAWFGQLGAEPDAEMFISHLLMIFREVKRVLRSSGNMFIVMDDTWMRRKFCMIPEMFSMRISGELGMNLVNKMVWAKEVQLLERNEKVGFSQDVGGGMKHGWEFVYHLTKSPRYYLKRRPVAVDCIHVNPEKHRRFYFATFPEMLARFLIEIGCPKGGLVLDPFLGSGTTAVAALLTNRNFLGIEIIDSYCRLAVRRLKRAGYAPATV